MSVLGAVAVGVAGGIVWLAVNSTSRQTFDRFWFVLGPAWYIGGTLALCSPILLLLALLR